MRHLSSLSLGIAIFLLSVAILPEATIAPLAQAETGQGEDAERGRLADGRAFRTDPEGNQLVDYIAELEVNLETLRTRVNGLEDEVKEKQSAIDRLRDEGRREAEVREKNLLAAQNMASKSVQVAAASCPTVTCDRERAKIQELSSSLELTKADLEVERQVSMKRASETQSSTETLQAKLTTQLSDMESLRKELVSAKEREASSTAEVARLQGELGGLRLAAERAAQETRSRTPVITSASVVTRAPVASKVSEISSVGADTQGAAVVASSGATSPAILGNASTSNGDARASLSVMRMRAVEVIRGKVRTELNQVRGTIATRDEMFRRYGSKKRTVAFTPSRPVSNSGLTLSEIAKKIQSASSVGELSVLTRDVSTIEQKMNDDIALMRRMDRVK